MEYRNYHDIDEKVAISTLPNGLSIYVVEKRDFQRKFAFFASNYGGVDRRFKIGNKWVDTPAGVAHFLEHEMFDMDYGNALDKLSSNGASPNAYTSSDITAYHFECTDKFTENLEILLGFVSTPYFSDDSVEKEKAIITQEILMTEDDPDFSLYYGILKSLFAHNPIRDSVAGTVESISEITTDILHDCHRVFYNPSNMVLCVVGDVNIHEITEIAEKILPSKQEKISSRDYGKTEVLSPFKKDDSMEMDVSLPIFFTGCKLPPPTPGENILRTELICALAFEIMLGHSSPLFFKLYSEGLVNADFSAAYDNAADASFIIFGGEARDPKRVALEVMSEINRICDVGIDSELFSQIKKATIGSHIRALNSFNAIAASTAVGHFRGFDAFKLPAILDSVKITDVSDFISNYLAHDNYSSYTINPRS